MKNLKKVAAVVLSATMVMSSSALAFGNEIMPINTNTDVAVESEYVNSVISGFGKVINVLNEDGVCQIEIDTEIEKDLNIVLNVSDNTIFMDNETGYPTSVADIKAGDRIYAYYSTAMTRSIPPQSAAKAILTNVKDDKAPARLMEVKEVTKRDDGSIKVLSSDGGYVVTILKENPIAPYKTKQIVTVDDIKEGSRIFAWFEIMTLSIPAQATADRVVILPDEVKAEIEVPEVLPTTVEINGEKIDLAGKSIFKSGNNYMVPLRAIGEKLGFEITWDSETNTANLDNKSVKTAVQISVDSYYKASSNAIGLTQAIKLGAAPVIVDGNTYVPVELFNLLFSNPETVKVTGEVISINAK